VGQAVASGARDDLIAAAAAGDPDALARVLESLAGELLPFARALTRWRELNGDERPLLSR
jgi:hypothetical protein